MPSVTSTKVVAAGRCRRFRLRRLDLRRTQKATTSAGNDATRIDSEPAGRQSPRDVVVRSAPAKTRKPPLKGRLATVTEAAQKAGLRIGSIRIEADDAILLTVEGSVASLGEPNPFDA